MFDTMVGIAAAGVRTGLRPVRAVGGALADELLAGPMTERVVQALGEHQIVERVADEMVAQGTVDKLADQLLAGPMTERVVQALGEHRIVERVADEMIAQGTVDELADRLVDDERIELVVARVAESPGLERLLGRVLESRVVLEMTDRIIASEEMQHVIRHIANSPELRAAMAEQSAGLAEDMASGVRTRTTNLDDAAERTVRGWLHRPRPHPA